MFRSLLISVTLATMQSAFCHSVSTDVDGILLRLDLAQSNVIAGERLPAVMIISNASPFTLHYAWNTAKGPRDTEIGDFIVADEFGSILRKTVPPAEWELAGSRRTMEFAPGASPTFPGDLVYGYSLTNPGTYFVRAIARVPTTNVLVQDTVTGGATMVIQTPWLELTVTDRPAESPAPAPLYRSIGPGQDLATVHRSIELNLAAFPPLQVTHPKTDVVEPPPRKGSKPLVLPKVQPGAESSPRNTGPADAQEISCGRHSRGMYSGVMILALLAICGIVIWRSRRRHQEPR